MTFFEHQLEARKATRRLLAALCLAMIGVNVVVYLAFQAYRHLVWNQPRAYDPYGPAPLTSDSFQWWDPQAFGLVWIITTAIVAAGAIFKLMKIGGKGHGVAMMLGGKPVDPSTDDPKLKQLINIAEEMAIASGCKMPGVYVLPGELAINAFAAGMSQDDAVIAVTEGALQKLDREQLQGVVAHEFSHILNSDVRLNMNLISAIGGLAGLSILGRTLLRAKTRGRNAGPVVAAGLGLYLIGLIGVLSARVIQASISRQREYLADASAVQFTRNPNGLAGALLKIQDEAHLRFLHPEEESIRHMMFASSLRNFGGLFATHPPLEERIRKLVPSMKVSRSQNSENLPSSLHSQKRSPAANLSMSLAGSQRERFVPASLLDSVGQLSLEGIEIAATVLDQIPLALRNLAHTSDGAKQVLLGLLTLESKSKDLSREFVSRTLKSADCVKAFQEGLGQLSPLLPTHRQALFTVALGALNNNEASDNTEFLQSCLELVDIDGHRSFFETAMIFNLHRSLAKKTSSRFGRQIQQNKVPTVTLLASCAWVGSPTLESADRSLKRGLAFLREKGIQTGTLSMPDQVQSGRDLFRSLQTLSELAPSDKELLILACAATFGEDGMISPDERAYLRLISGAVGAPIPLA